MPKVTVIIPIYGVEKYIERCATSLFKQTLDDIEYIFIDDCSPDNSVNILKQVLEKYPHRQKQTTIYSMPTNSGLAAVRRHGINSAGGVYNTL
jgi:glycosyltransferase involved in cell wall biosynthesis